MSSKEEKPTLAGVTVRTRKRNIVIPVDPGSFADAVVQIILDAAGDGTEVAKANADTGSVPGAASSTSLSEYLEAATKALDAADLEYARYGDTLFEVLFAGGRMASGAALAEGGLRLATNILACPATSQGILPHVKMFQALTRRRPFLVRGLENTLVKLLLSLEFFKEEDRRRVAITLALVFSVKLAVPPDHMFGAMFNERLAAKGTVQEVLTTFCQEFLAKESMDDLVVLLTKGKVANRLLDAMPPQKRTLEELNAHLKSANLESLVEWNIRRDVEIKIGELQDTLRDTIDSDSPPPPAEVLAMVVAKKAEGGLPEAEVLRVVWTTLLKGVNTTGKNQQQILQGVLSRVKLYHKLLSTFATSGKLELSLLLVVQVQCYEDNKLLKMFSDIVRMLYDADIVGEDTILHWYQKGSHPKGRNVFTKDIEPFIKWLEEAEEDGSGEEA